MRKKLATDVIFFNMLWEQIVWRQLRLLVTLFLIIFNVAYFNFKYSVKSLFFVV